MPRGLPRGALIGVTLVAIAVLCAGQIATVPWPSSNAQLSLDLDFYHYSSCGGVEPTADCLSEAIASTALQQVRQTFRLPACRFRLDESDCMTFVERCIAVGCAADWTEYYLILERLRHRDGQISFLSRNFFPLADWYQNNTWLFEDATSELRPTTDFTVVHRRKSFLSRLGFGEDDTPAGRQKAELKLQAVGAALEKEVFSGKFLPREEIEDAEPLFRPGDVALVIRTRSNPGQKPWFDCSHMGILGRAESGRVIIIHSAPPRVRQEPLWFFLKMYPFVEGLVVLRLRDDAPEAMQAELERIGPSISIPTPQELDANPRCWSNAD